MSHLGTLTKDDKEKLQARVEKLTKFLSEDMWPINEDHLDACIDYVVTKLFEYKNSNPFERDVMPKYTYNK